MSHSYKNDSVRGSWKTVSSEYASRTCQNQCSIKRTHLVVVFEIQFYNCVTDHDTQRICDKSVIELTLFNYSYTSKILIHNTKNENSVCDIFCFKISHSKTSYFFRISVNKLYIKWKFLYHILDIMFSQTIQDRNLWKESLPVPFTLSNEQTACISL